MKSLHRRRALAPEQIASRAVQKWFALAIANPAIFAGEFTHEFCPNFDTVMDEVTDALEAAWVAQHGPIKEGDDVVLESFGRQAGYLVGVQIGLRLRNVDGLR